jgi:hypothetical protein
LVNARRLLPLGIGVTALLAIAGIASHGRPLSGRAGSGPSATFFDYVATTLLIAFVVLAAFFLYSLFTQRRIAALHERGRWNLASSLGAFAVGLIATWLMLHNGFGDWVRSLEQNSGSRPPAARASSRPVPRHLRDPRVRWDEIAIVVVLIAGIAAVLLAGRRSHGAPRPLRLGRA